ncbi:MAG: LamG-like jellyroll fold domain-containing protein [Candidatus Odinarchaeota archaeon]
MTKRCVNKKKVISIAFLTIFTFSLLLTSLSTNFFDFNKNSEEEDNYNHINSLSNAQVGEDPWWNASYRWRQCIEITNPGNYNLTDNFVSIEFDYSTLRDNYNMDPDLYDVRIVENNILRNYYVKKDFPSNNYATIWFETNSTAGETDYDTYMYWGNASINDRGSTHLNYDPSGTSWWSFEEGSGVQGSSVIDSLNHADAHLYGSGGNYPVYDTDSAVGSYSLNYDGSNDFAYINGSMFFSGSNTISAVTVSCWFKTIFTGSSYSSNWAFFDFDRSEYFNFYIRGDDGRIGFSSSATGYSGQNDFYGSTVGLNDGEWHFACIVYDGKDKIIYIDDGAEDARWVNAMGGRAFGTGRTRYGFFGDGSEASSVNGGRNNIYYDGNIDEIRYFDYAVAPGEIKWLANYYPIDTNLLPVTERAASVTVLVKDVDGRVVPGAEVSLWQNATHILEVDGTTYTDFTLSDGTVSFTKVPFGFYNISVNYTLVSGLYEATVYDSRNEPSEEVEFKGLFVSTNITADLWTIDFEVNDWNGNPLNYGYIDISAGTSEILESLTLDSFGTTTFRWINRTNYNYTVYYDNIDYKILNPTPLNSSTITRGATQMIFQEIITVDMAKLEIMVIDNTETVLVDGATVRLTVNGTNYIVTQLKTKEDGIAYGQKNDDLIFWYKRGWTYNITLWIVNTQFNFKINYSDQSFNPDASPQSEYNYTLYSASTLIFEIALNFQDYVTKLENGTLSGGTLVNWGDNMNVIVNFSTSDNAGVDWIGDDGSGSIVTCVIKSAGIGNPILYETDMNPIGSGIFTIDINSSLFSAGYSGKSYLAVISGVKAGYKAAIDFIFVFTISPIPTGMTMHNYTTLGILPINEISQYYNELINVTLRFYDATTNNSLIADFFTFDWDYGSGSVNPDPINLGYYTLEIDTGDATNVGKYRVEISAGLENYSRISNFGFYINILSRPTNINGQEGILYIPENIYIFQEMNFTFEYKDALTSTFISNLDDMSYLLQKLDENGVPIPGTSETGSLIESLNLFTLDINTETRTDGDYSIIITLDKNNYDLKIAIISLTIMKRDFGVLLDPTKFVGTKISLRSGSPLTFTISLTDPNNITVPNTPVRGANVYLTVGGTDYNLEDNGDGTYTLVNSPSLPDAFFMPQTLIAMLTIEKQYFSTEKISVTIVVNMQEIFGIPTFYFLMIVGSIVAVAGSLVAYRTIQRARIPKFVKKAREMKKNIKGNKSISDSLLYPTKEEYITKKLGDKWREIGLTLEDILGISEMKKKKLPELKEEFKGGVD